MHFAAFINVGESVTDPLKYYKNNVVATLRLLETMLEEGVKKFVFSSTAAVFGIPEVMPIREDAPKKPINPYGQTKLDCENILAALAVSHGLSYAVFRYFNACGASEDGTIGEDHTPESHLIPNVIRAALGLAPSIKVFGTDYPTPDGTCLRDYIHVDDLSRAHIAAFDKLDKPGTALTYNLGTGRPLSVLEIIRAASKKSPEAKVRVSTGRTPRRRSSRRCAPTPPRPGRNSVGSRSSTPSSPSSRPPGAGTRHARTVSVTGSLSDLSDHLAKIRRGVACDAREHVRKTRTRRMPPSKVRAVDGKAAEPRGNAGRRQRTSPGYHTNLQSNV